MAKVKIKADVRITFEYDPDDPKELLKDPDDFLEGMLSTMDEVGRHNVDYTIISTKEIT